MRLPIRYIHNFGLPVAVDNIHLCRFFVCYLLLNADANRKRITLC